VNDIEELLEKRIAWHLRHSGELTTLPLTPEEFAEAENCALQKALQSGDILQLGLAMNKQAKELWFMGVKLVKAGG
jgi:hypothetical protein